MGPLDRRNPIKGETIAQHWVVWGEGIDWKDNMGKKGVADILHYL